MILPCDCNHAFQDKRYGLKHRVHNARKKGEKSSNQTYRCTVCGVVKDGPKITEETQRK